MKRVHRPIHLRAIAILAVAAAIIIGSPRPSVAQVASAASSGSLGADAASPVITRGELEGHVAHLADDGLAGRRAGTPGAERAARYVVRAFQAAGLEAPSSHPAYLQTFEFAIGVELGPENRLILQHGDRRVMVFEPGRDFLPLAGSMANRIVQPVAFAGYGISASEMGYDDYAGLDVRGRVVMVLRYGPEGDDPAGRFGRFLSERYKAATAAAHGASAILFVTGPATDEIDRLIPFQMDAEPGSLGIVALSISQSVGQRIAHVGGGELAAWQREIDESGKPRSRIIPDAVVNLRADLDPRTRSTHNIIGIVEGYGPDLANEAVLVGAHYDGLGLGGPGSLEPVPGEIHNGADDNASGVAALIELAQHFASGRNRPARTVVFVAFGAEEEGMLGSAHFVSHPVVPLTDLVAMINLDMIGRLKDELIIYGVGSSGAWPDLIGEANRDVGLPIRLMAEGHGPSDHAPFYRRQVPVLAFFTGVHEDYHRASDDANLVDYEGLTRVTTLVRHLVGRLAGPGPRPRFRPGVYEIDRQPAEVPTARVTGVPVRPGRSLGAVPVPGGPGEPVMVERVEKGSPADRAGVRAGDRIVSVDGAPIPSIYDYVRELDQASPRAGIRLGVERAGRTLELTVDLRGVSPPETR
ncbi:MAG: M20/M25/M40 family metallo-hydrolase [Gemmatimonadota bacterium]